MNHYWILLYLFVLLYNIHIYVESSDTGGITPDSSTPRKTEIFDLDSDDEIIVVDKNKPVKNPILVDTSHNNPRTLVAKQVVGDSGGGSNVTNGMELDLNVRTSTAFYDYDEQGNVESYIPKPGVVFGSIKTKSGDKKKDPYQVIWRAKDSSECAIKAELCYMYDKAQVLTIYLSNNNKKRIVKDFSTEWYEIDPDNRLPIRLNLSLLYHFYLDCEFYGYYRIYKAKDHYIFCGVVISDNFENDSSNKIWESTNPYEFANKILANGGRDVKFTTKVSVFLENGNILHYIKSKNGWVQRSHCIEIDININKATYEFSYNEEGYTRIYEPVSNFLISKVVFGTGNLGFKSYVIVWEAKSPDEYSNKLKCASNIIEPSANAVVELYLQSGKIIKLVNRNNKWVSVDPNKDLAVQISINRFIDSFCHYILNYRYFVIFVPRKGFVFNALTRFVGLLLSQELIWETHNPIECAYKVLVFDFDKIYNAKNIIIFQVNGNFTHLRLMDKKWLEIEPSVVLDISFKDFVIPYKYYKDDNNIEFFIPNFKYLFKGVKTKDGIISKSDVIIWTAKNNREYAFKAAVVKLGKYEKYLVLFLLNKEILILYQSQQINAWVDKSTDKNSIYELRQLGLDLNDPSTIKIPDQYKTTESLNKLVPSKPVSSDLTQTRSGKVDLFNLPMSLQKPKNLIDLDITQTYGLIGYDVLYIDNKLIFEARPGNVFKIVRKSDEIAWQPKKIGEYPNKVIYKILNGKEKIKVYFPGEIIPEEPKNKPIINFNPSEVQVEVSRVNRHSIMAM